MLPQVFSSDRFEKVASYTQIADQLGMVLGPLMAAALLKIWSWEFVVVSSALLFLAADGAIATWQRLVKPTLAEPEAVSGSWAVPIITALQHLVRLPGLMEVVLLAAAVNLVIGATLATSAAMVTGIHHETEAYYAILQTVGAVATVIILFGTAHAPVSLKALGLVAYALIFLGGLMTGLASDPTVYAFGFVLIIGFDKMFSVFIRSMRQRIIPRQDFGKTTGLVVMLNNLSQPLAGLLITLFASQLGAGLKRDGVKLNRFGIPKSARF
ncbi:hypothetical protein GCM10007857_86620 [Bradyrhizobium iriomotense]|uniref:Major facilitator superfamily (MFS) profile domain-containing protein n=2 Tax=Bradyrhizobium iriomotense TaxID=441950 RepID=A0ABQ6BC35_9BRAD|nr:hypothetical protein GCM10007857_86620 [Bradyrhizobium iriomotense]